MLRVTNIVVFSETKTWKYQPRHSKRDGSKLPLAGSSGGINDGLGCFNLPESSGIGGQGIIIGIRVKTSNVDVAITGNKV
jgi:hypothetical protein